MVISLDIQRAFDNLQLSSIRNSLDKLKFNSKTTETLKDVLENREVLLQTSQGTAAWSQQKGCAQGSCSGQVFWNLVANKILSEKWPPNIHLQAFADDFVFVVAESTRAKLKSAAQDALSIFKCWTDKHHLQISVEKSCNILISKLVNGPTIKWNNVTIKRQQSLKYLGVTIDNKLNWIPHLLNTKTKATLLYQNLSRIAGSTWGLKKEFRRHLYFTVAERMILHGASAWAYPLSSRQQRILISIQRKFLLSISGASRTTSTAVLQVIEGILPLHINAQAEATYVRNFPQKRIPTYKQDGYFYRWVQNRGENRLCPLRIPKRTNYSSVARQTE
ncbi:putative 115 kDa protein in type-1 like protein [Argiope bruennichi]|uniref:Putative 115 kDa protein in type-1 like protein n=1 Tax=Argiope bruennichi TaxID=94029 RepID=A0A8T0FTF1_ARGBR|nr:putative 115 kDa protein in type-1 like protein [Argiope bruennichi]